MNTTPIKKETKMEILKIQEHGNKAVQYLRWAVSELNAIKNESLAEHIGDLATMLERNVEDLPYLQQAEEIEIYHEFG
jgi:hypothetical protein